MKRRNLLAGTGAIGALSAATVTAPAVTSLPAPDAALLQLGERFEAAWAAENAAWDALPHDDESSPRYHRACDLSEATDAVVDEIKDTPATTLPGLLVKARAFQYSRGTQAPPSAGMFWTVSQSLPLATEEEMVLSMLRDLHALTGGAA